MKIFDEMVNKIIAPASTTAGVGTVILSFFSGKLFPRIPDKFYKLLDNDIVRTVIVWFLVNQQLKKPSQSVLWALGIVVVINLLVKTFAPDMPKLSEIVKPEKETKSEDKVPNCYCGPVYIVDGEKHKVTKTSGNQNAIPKMHTRPTGW